MCLYGFHSHPGIRRDPQPIGIGDPKRGEKREREREREREKKREKKKGKERARENKKMEWVPKKPP